MAEEEVKGPQELTEKKLDSESETFSSDSENERENEEEGDEYHMEKLRQYQLNRLKYYYAVIECNSVGAADKLYAECDGLEYESTATKLDLRFIPDDMTFDDEPKEVCTEMPELTKYKPRLFTTTALQQAKVELTWDENDLERNELNEKVNSGKLNEVADADLRKFVAYSSEEEENDVDAEERNIEESIEPDSTTEIGNGKKSKKNKKEDVISKYKSLLDDINKKEEEKKKNRIEMEFSWGIDTTESKKKDKKASASSTTDELTPFEKIIEKKRQKKRAHKEKIRELKKASKSGEQDSDEDSTDSDLPDGVDLNDPYFAEEFANGEFEPVNSKKNKSKKKSSKNHDDDNSENDAQKDLELLLDDDDNKAHFSLKKIQERENESKTSKKRRKQLKNKKSVDEKKPVDDDFKINLNDDRFSALFSSHLYNIDPTDSHYRKTTAMESLVHEKIKRKPADVPSSSADNGEPSTKKSKRDVADSILVKSIKRKVQQQTK